MDDNYSAEQRSRRRTIIAAAGFVATAFVLTIIWGVVYMTRYGYYVEASASMQPALPMGTVYTVDRWAFYKGHLPRRGDIVMYKTSNEAMQATGEKEKQYIHRVVALPGDSVEIHSASITANGRPVVLSNSNTDTLHEIIRHRMNLPDDARVQITRDGIVCGNRMVPASKVASLLKVSRKLHLMPGQVIVNGKPLDDSYCWEDVDYSYPTEGNIPFVIPEGQVFLLGDNRNHAADSHVWGAVSVERLVGLVSIPKS